MLAVSLAPATLAVPVSNTIFADSTNNAAPSGGATGFGSGIPLDTPRSNAITDDVPDAAAQIVYGTSAWARFASKVYSVGDMNGDGIDDLVSVARNPWTVSILAGGSGAFPTSALVSLHGSPGDIYGVQVAGGGDLNDDGFDDLAITVGRLNTDGSYEYVVEVRFGASDLTRMDAPQTLLAPALSSSFGVGLAMVADMDGDRYDELLVSAPPPLGTSEYGHAWLFEGAGTGIMPAARWDYTPTSPGGAFGAGAASMGDLNGDGRGDFVVTTAGQDGTSGRSEVFVFQGGASFGIVAPERLVGEQDDDGFGTSVAAGDFNGDGRSDLLVGAPGFDAGAELTDSGRAYEYRRPLAGGSLTLTSTRDGAPEQQYGSALSAVGDLNGDGYDDAVVGAPLASADGPVTNGQYFAYFGGTDGLTSVWDFTEAGQNGNDLFASTLAGGGDYNGDGMDDLAVGAPGRDAGGFTDAGAVYLYSGARLRMPEMVASAISLPDIAGGLALARNTLPYHAVISFVYRGAAGLDRVEQTISVSGQSQRYTFVWTATDGVTLQGPAPLQLEMVSDSGLAEGGPYRHGYQFKASMRFAWEFADQAPVDVWGAAADSDGTTSTASKDDAFRVVSTVSFASPLSVKRADGSALASGGFVRSQEVLEWSGGHIVYTGTDTVPPTTEFFALVIDARGGSARASVDTRTGDIRAAKPAGSVSSMSELHRVQAFSPSGAVLGESSFLLAVDASPVVFVSMLPATGAVVTTDAIQVTAQLRDAYSGVDAGSIEWSISHSDPPSFTTWSPAQTSGADPVTATAGVTLEQGGSNFVQFRARDVAGNGPLESPVQQYALDFGAVTFTQVSPMAQAWLRQGTFTATFQVANTRGLDLDLASLEYQVSSPSPGPWTAAGLTGTSTVATASMRMALPDGPANMVSLRVKMADRTEVYVSQPFRLAVDSQLPQMSFVSPAPGSWATGTTAVSSLHIEDFASGADLASVRYRFLPPGAVTWSAWLEPAVRADGAGYLATGIVPVSDGVDNFVEWTVSDLAGNGPALSGYQRVLVDTKPVRFLDPSPAHGSKLAAVARVGITVSDGEGSGVDLSTLEYMVERPGGVWAGWVRAGASSIVSVASVSVPVSLATGTYIIHWRAQDAARNPVAVSDPASVTVLGPKPVDLPPRVVLRSPLANAHLMSDVDIRLDAAASTDPEGQPLTFVWVVDGNELSVRGPVAWVSLPPGHHTVTVVATDGTSAPTVKTVQFNVVSPSPAPGPLSSSFEQALVVCVGALVGAAALQRVWLARVRRLLR